MRVLILHFCCFGLFCLSYACALEYHTHWHITGQSETVKIIVADKIPANYFWMQKVAFFGREHNTQTHKNTHLIVNRNRCQGTLAKMIKMVFCTILCGGACVRLCRNPTLCSISHFHMVGVFVGVCRGVNAGLRASAAVLKQWKGNEVESVSVGLGLGRGEEWVDVESLN